VSVCSVLTVPPFRPCDVTLCEEIGRGASGRVYRAVCALTHAVVAVKIVSLANLREYLLWYNEAQVMHSVYV